MTMLSTTQEYRSKKERKLLKLIKDRIYMVFINNPKHVYTSEYITFWYTYNEIMETTIKEVKSYEYILCIGYNPESGYDSQLGITGTRIDDELIINTTNRELKEEISHEIKNIDDIKYIHPKKIKMNKKIINWHGFICNANNLKYVDNNMDNDVAEIQIEKSEYNKECDKVFIMITGTIDKLIEIMRSSKPMYDQENIHYYSILSQPDMMTIIKDMKKMFDQYDNVKYNKKQKIYRINN